MERIIITVPLTVGVTTRLRMNSQREMASWAPAETSSSVVSVAGPPSATAVMQNGIAKAAVNIGSTAPAPTKPSRRTCNSVERPTTTSEAKTIHTTYGSPRSDALATITGVTSSVADAIRPNCAPRPRVVRSGGRSCACSGGVRKPPEPPTGVVGGSRLGGAHLTAGGATSEPAGTL